MNNQENPNFDFLDLIKFVSTRWVLLTILLMFGGLAGLMFSYLRPAVYESSAAFGVIIDYTQTGALSDVEVDQAMRGVGSLLLSDSLIADTLQRINSEGVYNISEEDFRENAFADRGDFRWMIRFRGSDPKQVLHITQHWKDVSIETFGQSLTDAKTAETYLRMHDELIKCYQKSELQSSGAACGFENSKALLNEIAQLSERIQEEKQASHGLFYALSVNLVYGAELPDKPVRHQTGISVIAGALAGLLIAMAYLMIQYFRGGRSI